MNSYADYWIECLSIAAEDCGATLTDEQIKEIAASIQSAHENYGMAFYTPPSSDRHNAIEREWKERLRRLENEFDAYRNNAEIAVKKALKQYPDAQVTIGEYGEVLRHGGRTEVIQ